MKHRILIVDDDPVNVEILRGILADKYILESVTSGEAALNILPEFTPELILLDVMMPGLDGIEVCRRIRAIQKYNCKIILVTGKVMVEERIEGYNAGADDYVTKPFVGEELEAKIKVFLRLIHTEYLEKLVEERTAELAHSNEMLRQNEIKIRELNNLLEERIADRTEKLQHAQNEIVKKEYKSELADITTGTLHNVKNILTSVKISSETVGKILSGATISNLRKANSILKENLHAIENFILNDPKGKKLLTFYLKLEEVFDQEAEESRKHLKRMLEKVHAIEQIIAAQQEYGKNPYFQNVKVSTIIDDALTMQAGSIENYGIKIIREIKNAPEIFVQKTKFMHILINLIKNAKEAMIGTPVEERFLKISSYCEDNSVYIKVNDSGHGISPENIEKLFTYGFTTKEDGHGFGLHSCRAYMKEMGGTMWAESEGKGASFFLKLPLPEKAG